MTTYKLSYTHPEKHYLNINVVKSTGGKANVVFQLPAWRPGRYELGNFAKNIRDFTATNEHGEKLEVFKKSKDSWLVRTEGAEDVILNYDYFANELNAGATYLDEVQLYVNPINCFIYELDTLNDPCTIELPIKEGQKIAHTFTTINATTFSATSFHDVVDCPFIISDRLQSKSYESNGINFYIWFQGEVKPQWEKLIDDFKKFTDYQLDKFGSFPEKEYHFLNQISPFAAYHGVEHFKSTVIHLGPSYEIFNKLYTELLGVSSHELYHVWNVKAIRPQEMFPYDYARENYTQLGYVAEGVTTYMGDRILFESGVFDEKQYNKEVLNYITRHFHNDGRNHLSVAESSYDTWLDGYVLGVPGRKTSIYVEGCLIAYICDMRIRKSTNNKASLHDVMTKMYELTNQRVGYSETIYQETLELIGGTSFQDVFDDLILGTEDFTPYLLEAFKFENKKLVISCSDKLTNVLGLKGIQKQDAYEVKVVLENSAAYNNGVVEGDFIVAVNGLSIHNDLDKWLNYFTGEDINLTIKRNGQLKHVELTIANDYQFYNYRLETISQ
jgi:predicted metalloprotease with PDZ domain